MTTKVIAPYASLGAYLVKVLIEEVRNVRLPWAVLPADQQQQAIDRMADQVTLAVTKAMKEAMGAGFPCVIAKLKEVKITEDVRAILGFGATELHALTDYVGSDVVLVLADPEAHTTGALNFRADADQPSLPLEDGA